MMHFRHDAEVVHHTCDRTRLRIPHRRGDSLYFEQACRRISELPGVTSANANRHSAAIVIRHAHEFQMERITEALHGAVLAAPLAEPGGEYFSERQMREHGRAGKMAAMVLQLAVAYLSGTALTHVLELLAGNLIEAAFRQLPAEVRSGLASA